MADEVDIEVCCEGLEMAIEDGAVLVVPAEGGYVEGLLCADKKTVVAIVYCPFCGAGRGEQSDASDA